MRLESLAALVFTLVSCASSFGADIATSVPAQSHDGAATLDTNADLDDSSIAPSEVLFQDAGTEFLDKVCGQTNPNDPAFQRARIIGRRIKALAISARPAWKTSFAQSPGGRFISGYAFDVMGHQAYQRVDGNNSCSEVMREVLREDAVLIDFDRAVRQGMNEKELGFQIDGEYEPLSVEQQAFVSGCRDVMPWTRSHPLTEQEEQFWRGRVQAKTGKKMLLSTYALADIVNHSVHGLVRKYQPANCEDLRKVADRIESGLVQADHLSRAAIRKAGYTLE